MQKAIGTEMLMSKPAFPAAAAILLAVAASTATAQTVDPVEIHALPTQVTVSVAGKDLATLRRDVRQAAHYVCRNARAIGELDVGDHGWCAFHANAKAMKRYHQMTSSRLAETQPAIVLSAR